MTAADKLLADLRAKTEELRADYYRVREERNEDFGPEMRKALRLWGEAMAREDGAREMMRAIIGDES